MHAALHAMMAERSYPCLGGRAAINGNSYWLRCYGEFGCRPDTIALANNLDQFTISDLAKENDFATFIAVFASPRSLPELDFETTLWQTLRILHERDMVQHSWDGSVSSNPADANFAFSFAGHAYYVVGLHPQSSRLARRFPYPALVFNLHAQFQKLRDAGKWEKMRSTIRQRDVALQGSANPMLSDFGERSEARQYSGRAVEEKWEPDFHPNLPARCPFGH